MYKYIKIKRFLDIIFAIILILLTWWLMLIVLIITYIDLKRPLIDIRIPREGLHKKPFYMYKIRTRVYDEFGSHYTKVSKVIDVIGLNELPQIFNVLKGDMSFIGPRPFICGEKLPEGKISETRYLVKPGIISLAQSKGGRMLPYSQMLKCDDEYYNNFGFKQDLKIFFKSILKIIKQMI